MRSARGIDIGAEALADPHGLVVPGGGWLDRSEHGARAEHDRGVVPAFIRDFAAGGGWVASVCTGAFLLGAAGLLEGRDATTNTHALADLRPFAGRVLDERVVDAGPVITSQGPSSGIDLGLHLVERFLGAEAAAARADGMDYERP